MPISIPSKVRGTPASGDTRAGVTPSTVGSAIEIISLLQRNASILGCTVLLLSIKVTYQAEELTGSVQAFLTISNRSSLFSMSRASATPVDA